MVVLPNRTSWLSTWLRSKMQAVKIVKNSEPDSGMLLEQSQKMEAIGRLAGGVAHDFNNLLAVITGYSDLLLDDHNLSDPNRTKVEQIKQAAQSAASLTRQLLMFSRQQIIQPVILDVNQTVKDIEKMLRRLIKENIEFTVVLDAELDQIKADPGQIEQVVLNLVVNARDAMPNGGKLRIQTRNVSREASNQGFVLLQVSDTGMGMDRQTQSHIFEPFFTTKPAGKGTGLGLATVYGIVKQSNGHIEVETVLGSGSSFKIYFPAAQSMGADCKIASETARPVFSDETVLVVEDAPALRGVIQEALSGFGCKVLSAANGKEALTLLIEHECKIDLLLTDVVMPGMNGPTLAKEVRALHPQTKILYMTGYSGEFIRVDMLTPGVSLIQKPFTPADLGRKVSKMLADAPRDGSQKEASSHKAILRGKAVPAQTSG
jgi:two-component system, cell cycle sensor histidine kinase and response regulator CckA